MPAKPQTIDEYLAPLSPEKRAALERLRKDIRAAAPEAEECISYQIPTFRLSGKMLVSFGAATNHCAFYPGAVVDDMKAELAGYDISKGTIRFQPDEPLPASLVRKLVEARIAKNAAAKRPAKSGGGRHQETSDAGGVRQVIDTTSAWSPPA